MTHNSTQFDQVMQLHNARQTDRAGKTSNQPTALYTDAQRALQRRAEQYDRDRFARWQTWQQYDRDSQYLTSAQRSRLSTWRNQRRARMDTTARPRRRLLCHLVACAPDSTHGALTDTAAHYINRVARVMTYTALKTQWVRSGHPYVYRLMMSAWADTRRCAYSDTRRTIEQYVDTSGDPMTCQTVKTRRRTRVAGVYIPCNDTYTETTAAGREYINADIADACVATDYDDCISVAVLALLERADTMRDYADVWQARTYVYRAVNRYVHSQRARRAEMDAFDRYCVKTDDDGNETIITGAAVDRDIVALLDADGRRAICDYVRDNCTNKSACSALYYTMAGMTVRDAAGLLDMSKSAVDRAVRAAYRALDTVHGRKFMASILFA